MSVYGNSINESVILESSLKIKGISKEDLNNKDKIFSKIEDENKKKGPFETILFVLQIIGFCIVCLIGGLTFPIWYPLMNIINKLIDKVEDSKKNKAIDKVIEEYKKQIKKLEKQLSKEKDPEKQKQLKEAISEIEKQIKLIEEKRINDKFIKDNKDGFDIIDNITSSNPYISDPEDMSLWMYYYNISQKEFHDSIGLRKDDDDILNYVDEKDNKELYDYFNKYRGDKYAYFILIDDTVFIYNVECIKSYTFDEFKNNYKEFNKHCWNQIVNVDKYYGYYRLSSPPSGVKPVPLPKHNKK